MDAVYRIIKQEIDNWDPIGLLEMSCPDDEYDIESNAIYSKYKPNVTNAEFGAIIHQVFYENFEDTFKFSKAECTKIANKIIEKLQ